MPQPRRRAAGAIRRLPSGRFQASRVVDGARVPAPSTFENRRAAERWLALVDDVPTAARPTGAQKTLHEYALIWIALRQVKPTTKRAYSYLLSKWIAPSIGHYPIDKLTVEITEWWVATVLVNAGGRTRAAAYGLARTICADAVTKGHIPRNPIEVARAGVVPRRERDPRLPKAGELEALSEALGDVLGALVPLQAWFGLRIGEALGLRPEDVDVEARKVTVMRTVSTRSEYGPPKTVEARRTVSGPKRAMPLLVARLDAVDAGWLFPAWKDDAKPLSYGVLQPRWAAAATRAAKAVGAHEPLHCHDLRHHALSRLAEVGATTAELCEFAGWAPSVGFEMAARYVHVATGAAARNAARLDELD